MEAALLMLLARLETALQTAEAEVRRLQEELAIATSNTPPPQG